MGSGRLKYLVAAFQIKIRVIASQRPTNVSWPRQFAACLLCSVVGCVCTPSILSFWLTSSGMDAGS